MIGRRRVGPLVVAALLGPGLAGAAFEARAAVHVELLVVGNNEPFSGSPDGERDPSLPSLRYADDDAAAFYDLLAEGADTAHLLTVMDADTQAKFPKLPSVARPPTAAQLRAAIASIEEHIERNRLRGEQNVLYVFYSGHGAARTGHGPALALLDGEITHGTLYDEILGRLHADTVHVFVDACHAEGVVRPRDSEARAVAVDAGQADAFLTHSTLARFPQVGAIVAASIDAQAHEWDQLGQGVFTSELLSALRGAADVNRDGRIEYSEAYAYLASANRGVADPRARLSVVARPPQMDRHAAIVDPSLLARGRVVRLSHIPAGGRLVQVEDGQGRRLATLRGEADFVVDLLLPAGTTYVRVDHQEASFEGRTGALVAFGDLKFAPPRARARGPLEDALRRGLFQSEFGRGYYMGFTDSASDFAAVTFAATPPPSPATEAVWTGGRPERTGRTVDLIAGLGIAGPVAQELGIGAAVRLGIRSPQAQGVSISFDLARASGYQIAETQALGSVGWLWARRRGTIRGWVGGALGAGLVEQAAAGKDARRSGVFTAGPRVGGSLELTKGADVWMEGELCALFYRADDRSAVGLRPALLVGASLDL